MFDFIKRTKSPQTTATEWMARFDLERKPFARALLGRTSHDVDENYRELTRLAKSHLKVNHGKDLVEFTESSAQMFAKAVMEDALQRVGYPSVFSPFEPVPNHAPLAFSFAGFVILGLISDLKTEGISVNVVNICAELAITLLMERPKEEMRTYGEQFNVEFQRLLRNDTEQMREWRKFFMPLVRAYVLQWDSDNPQLKSMDLRPPFAEMLKSLLQMGGYRAAR